jgi:hypothetical protein
VKYGDVFSESINLQTLWRILLINTGISVQITQLLVLLRHVPSYLFPYVAKLSYDDILQRETQYKISRKHFVLVFWG